MHYGQCGSGECLNLYNQHKLHIRRKVLTEMHDVMSAFFIVTTSDLISQNSKTAKKLGFMVHFV